MTFARGLFPIKIIIDKCIAIKLNAQGYQRQYSQLLFYEIIKGFYAK